MRPVKALRSLEQYGAENYSWRASTLCSLRPQNVCRLWRQSGAQLLPRCSREPRYCAVHLIWRAARLQDPRCSRAAVRRPRLEVAAGVPTQLPGFVGAFVVALMLLLASSLLRNPPAARVSGGGNRFRHRLVEVSELIRIFHIQPWEFWLSIVCFAGVAVLGGILGIGLAVAIAIIGFLWAG